MSAYPDLVERVVHGLDLAYGIACLAFLVVAVRAVVTEIRMRRRLGAPLFGALPS